MKFCWVLVPLSKNSYSAFYYSFTLAGSLLVALVFRLFFSPVECTPESILNYSSQQVIDKCLDGPDDVKMKTLYIEYHDSTCFIIFLTVIVTIYFFETLSLKR